MAPPAIAPVWDLRGDGVGVGESVGRSISADLVPEEVVLILEANATTGMSYAVTTALLNPSKVERSSGMLVRTRS
jgi:hypothetical protein